MHGCAGAPLGDAEATKDVGHLVNAAISKPMAKQANSCSASAASRVGNPGFIVNLVSTLSGVGAVRELSHSLPPKN
jgi:hypothetical protein